MECKDVQNMITEYIDGTLSDYDLGLFLNHIESCPECYDELEIYYTFTVGMKKLDSDENSSYDLNGAMKKSLADSAKYIRLLNRLKIIRYVTMTLAFYGVLVTIFLLLRDWLFF